MKHIQKSLHAPGLILLVIILLYCVSCQSGGSVLPTQEPLKPEEQSIADQLDQHFIKVNDSGYFSGAVLASKAGKILLNKGYGFSNQEKKIPITPQTHFPLYTATKPFTSLAIYLLQMDGKLSLDDPICQYLEECPASWKQLTIDDLLQVRKNIPDYIAMNVYRNSKNIPISQNDLVKTIESIDYIEESGGWSTWSGFSDYILLGAIIERISGKTYEQFLEERIFDPAGMKNSGLIHGDGVKDNLALMYDTQGTSLLQPVDYSHYYSAWGLYSTVEDIFLFLRALDNGKLLPADQLDSYIITDTLVEDYSNKNGWAYLKVSGKQFRFVTHPGEKGAGFSISLDEKGTYLILISNLEFIKDEVWARPPEILFELDL